MRFIISILVLATFLISKEVKVTADEFIGNEVDGKMQFIGHMEATKDKDILKANKLIIYFNKKRKPTKYEATGNATIKVFIKNKEYFGKGNSLIYLPKEDTYMIKGNAFLEEKTQNRKVYGNIIKVNQKNGKYEVKSQKNKPAVFTFEIDDKKKSDNEKK